LWIPASRIDTLLGENRDNLVLLKSLIDGAIERARDLLRGPFWSKYAGPERNHYIGVAELERRRNVGQRSQSLRACHCHKLHHFTERREARQGADRKLNVARSQLPHSLHRAAEWHVDHFDLE